MKIITTVGTSLISNSNVDCSNLENEKFSESKFEKDNDFFKRHIKSKEDALFHSINGDNASAELSSLKKIDPTEQADIYLLCTETVTSCMCGRVLERYLGERANVKIIPDLQVKNAKDFEEKGFLSLIENIKFICENKDDKVVLNISGGYKALIPAMTLVAQLEKIPLYYLFEEGEDIIEIENLPINFDWEVIEQYHEFLHNANKRSNKASDEEIQAMRDLKLVKSDSKDLTIVGNLLSQYSNRASPFTETIFGYFIEHKVYEYFAIEYGRDKVEHSVKLEGMGSADIDILITPEQEKFIPIEIKPSYVLSNIDNMQRILKAFVERVNAAKSVRGKVIEIWLLVYSYTDKKNDVRSLDCTEKTMSEELAEGLREGIDKDMTFKVLHFFIERNKLSSERHVYQTFMKTALKPTKIKEIFNSSKSKT